MSAFQNCCPSFEVAPAVPAPYQLGSAPAPPPKDKNDLKAFQVEEYSVKLLNLQATKQGFPDKEKVRPDKGSTDGALGGPATGARLRRLQSVCCFRDPWTCVALVENVN